MKVSRVVEARTIAHSPSGQFAASITGDRLLIRDVHINNQDRGCKLWIDPKQLISSKFSDDGSGLVLLSRNRVEVVSRKEPPHHLRVDNGSGALGFFQSADFLGPGYLLTIWEFGRAKVWNIQTGSSTELGDIKTGCEGASWTLRPRLKGLIPTLVHLAKNGADDVLCIRSQSGKVVKSLQLLSIDVHDVSWSQDGRWFALRDSPLFATDNGVHFYSPDGNRFMTYPRAPHHVDSDLGIKSVTWSPAGDLVALSDFHGSLVFLDTMTFLPRARSDHTSTILQSEAEDSKVEASIWRETASASNERAYESKHQPATLVKTRSKPSADPQELGLAETIFNCTGRYLATRDERFQSTIWIWDIGQRISGQNHVGLHAVLMQYRNVRKVQWHPTRPHMLLFDCGEDTVYHYNVDTRDEPPSIVNMASALKGSANYSWIPFPNDELVILAATKRKHCMLYLFRAFDDTSDEVPCAQPSHASMLAEEANGESDLEDSLHDILRGRTPLPAPSHDSYTEMVGLENDAGAEMEDTFREKKRKSDVQSVEWDPLDDSDIF
ncbi:hypothetical protein LTR08_000927 [Meristemomyces frigidus]|nr:hypothetical protein LTR08_000927 [Meristemomyces frigidus]